MVVGVVEVVLVVVGLEGRGRENITSPLASSPSFSPSFSLSSVFNPSSVFLFSFSSIFSALFPSPLLILKLSYSSNCLSPFHVLLSSNFHVLSSSSSFPLSLFLFPFQYFPSSSSTPIHPAASSFPTHPSLFLTFLFHSVPVMFFPYFSLFLSIIRLFLCHI